MKIKVTNVYEINENERRAIAWSIKSKNELASHKECRDYLIARGDADLSDLIKSYYAHKAAQYQKMAEGE